MQTIFTRVAMLFLTLGFVACLENPVAFNDPSVMNGVLKGKITSKCVVQQCDTRAITLNVVANWQNSKQYSIVGTAVIGDKTDLTVVGTGFAGDFEYLVSPRTPATRPPRTLLEFRNASGTLFAVSDNWFMKTSYSSNFEPNSFLGFFQFMADSSNNYELQINY